MIRDGGKNYELKVIIHLNYAKTALIESIHISKNEEFYSKNWIADLFHIIGIVYSYLQVGCTWLLLWYYYTYTVLLSYTPDTVIILCSYYTHTPLILCSYYTHTISILNAYTPRLKPWGVLY